jgi:hypothetical protein
MARILFGDTFLEELAPGSILEVDFERVVIATGRLIFPDFHIVPFKTPVFSDEDCAIADLALVEKSYREWWVVEVELGNHSLGGHVLPQVRTLSAASYGEDQGRILCDNCHDLMADRISDMLKGKQPRVLVIVDAERKEWLQPLKRYEAELLVLQMFRSDRNDHALRIDGHLPAVSSSIVSECKFDPFVPRFLVVHSPALLGVLPGEKISVRHGTFVTEWQRVDCQDKVWLAPSGQNPLSSNETYQIVRVEDGSLEFRVLTNRAPRRK